MCQTSSLKSSTRDPIMVQKRLVCSQARGPPIEGILSLVDLPGNFDTDNRKEVCNLASIRKFVDSMFASREGISILAESRGKNARSRVFPNLVLFTLKATDNRLEGNNTDLRKALTLLKTHGDLIDTEIPNLIILITHVCSLGLEATYFNEDLKEKRAVISKTVREVLGLTDVDIIPIENQPSRYQLPKIGEYYKLPNDELSHYNLYQAILKRLERNNDQIGSLLASWYFQSTCPEKQTAAEVNSPTIEVNYSDLAKAATELHILQKGTNPINPVTIFKFDTLGYGYCPATEKLKLNIIPKRDNDNVTKNMKQVKIEGHQFLIPKYVSIFPNNCNKFQRLTFLEKEEYQESMKKSYGIDSNLKLNMLPGSDGKWMNAMFDRRGIRLVSFSQELQVCSFQLQLSPGIFKESLLYKELMSLPEAFKCEDDAKQFLSFFAKWGTHLVCEEAVGGSFQLNCTMKQGSVNKDNVQKIENDVKNIFSKLFCTMSPFKLSEIYSHVQNLRSAGVIQESLEIQGGDHWENVEWESTTFDDVEKWKKSVAAKPVELRKSIKLLPFYELLENKSDNRYKSLFEATKRYMEEPGASCFPKGTMICMASGEEKPIEDLSTRSNCSSLQTVGLSKSMQLGNIKNTDFCTFLDNSPNDFVEYIVLQFSNDKKLKVSPGHMIFQYILKDRQVVGKQAKYFIVGDMAVYKTSLGVVETPEIESIYKEKCIGAFSPLTTSGTFLADGFLVTSYANIDSFKVAQGALFPLKMWCKLNQKVVKKNSCSDNNYNDLAAHLGIHPYAKFLMSVRTQFKSCFAPK